MAKATNQTPSQVFGIAEFAAEITGMPDMWTAFQFDSAVAYFGVWMENKLNEMDYDAKPIRPKHTLKELLDDTPKAAAPKFSGKGVNPGLKNIRRVKRDGSTA